VSDKVKSLGAYMERAFGLRELWKTPVEKEIWFCGEDRQYPTFLRPELYRPGKSADGTDQPLKTVPELLKIENDLYEEFQRCAVQLRTERAPEEDWDWDAYFLMQHHGAPTRLLDWSDGALMALHFAVRSKPRNDPADAMSTPSIPSGSASTWMRSRRPSAPRNNGSGTSGNILWTNFPKKNSKGSTCPPVKRI
jgi:FRG domain